MNAAAFLDALVEPIAERVACKLKSTPADEWVPFSKAGYSVRTLRAARKAGTLKASKIGREYYARRSDLDEWAAAQERPTNTKAEETPAERAIARAASAGRLRRVV